MGNASCLQAQLPIMQQLALLMQQQREQAAQNAAAAAAILMPQQQGLYSHPDLRALSERLGSGGANGRSAAGLPGQEDLLQLLSRQATPSAMPQLQPLTTPQSSATTALVAHLQAMHQLETFKAQHSQQEEASALQVIASTSVCSHLSTTHALAISGMADGVITYREHHTQLVHENETQTWQIGA